MCCARAAQVRSLVSPQRGLELFWSPPHPLHLQLPSVPSINLIYCSPCFCAITRQLSSVGHYVLHIGQCCHFPRGGGGKNDKSDWSESPEAHRISPVGATAVEEQRDPISVTLLRLCPGSSLALPSTYTEASASG